MMIWSSLAEARNRPLRLKRTQFTAPRWFTSVASSLGTASSASFAASSTGARFHTFTLLSPPPVAKRLPSGWMSSP